MSLEEELEPLAMDTAVWLASVGDPTFPIDQLGDLCLELEGKLRSLGIILLLSAADSDTFVHNLMRAGRTWEAYLARCRKDGKTEEHNYCAGLFSPLLDALAARDQALAVRLVTTAPADHRPGHENEDDYCYAKALAPLMDATFRKDDVNALLDRCVETGNSMSAARADVLRAIMTGKSDAFEEAFARLLQERTQEIAADQERGQTEDVVIVAQRRIFIEGIALLNLAESHGITTETDYLMCPSIARVRMVRPFTD